MRPFSNAPAASRENDSWNAKPNLPNSWYMTRFAAMKRLGGTLLGPDSAAGEAPSSTAKRTLGL